MNRLREFYEAEIIEAMTKKFSYKNVMAVPKLDKIVINMGVGEAKDNAKVLDGAVKDLTIISGQKPLVTKAKKSVAARLHLEVTECMSLQTDSSTSLSLVYVTSEALKLIHLMAEATTQWVSKNSLSSLKSNMIK